jgi:hypothetical protein
MTGKWIKKKETDGQQEKATQVFREDYWSLDIISI